MDPTFSTEAELYRKQVREILGAAAPEGWSGLGALAPDEARAFVDRWREVLHEHGFLAPSWPATYGGGGLTATEQVVLAEELRRAGLPRGGPNDQFSIEMIGNTILRWGTEEQKAHFLPRILSGEDRWCQGYSEVDAGSDLAAVRCRAVADGDEWRIDGQKTWTSAGHLANWIFVVARTGSLESRHCGVTFLLVPMDQPGVETRPIEMLSGGSEFNEVYFTDARCPIGNVLGPVDGGWPVAMTLLGHERGATAASYPGMFRTELDRLVALARAIGLADDPVVRQRIAWCHSRVEVMRYLGLRSLTDWLAGRDPGPEATVFKLFWSEYHREATRLALDVLGADALAPTGRWPSAASATDQPGAPNDSASWVGTFYNAVAGTIYAGTSEIQRNILAETALGLPKEPRPAPPTSS